MVPVMTVISQFSNNHCSVGPKGNLCVVWVRRPGAGRSACLVGTGPGSRSRLREEGLGGGGFGVVMRCAVIITFRSLDEQKLQTSSGAHRSLMFDRMPPRRCRRVYASVITGVSPPPPPPPTLPYHFPFVHKFGLIIE